jgi:acyl carrier protein
MPGTNELAIRKFIASSFMYREGVESLEDTDSFLEKGLIDSTGVLELVFFIEKTFGVKVNDNEVLPENLDSIERICAFIQRKLAPVSAARVA